MDTVINKIKRLSIATQAGVLMTLMLIGTCSVLFFWATENGVAAELRHARTVADMADSFRTVASKHGGFYVRRNSEDDVKTVGKYLADFRSVPSADGVEYIFHQKNPFLALADYSQAVQASAAEAKFRITSDNYMNPANTPDLFDIESIALMRENQATEVWQVKGDQIRYARALVADQSCLRCHSTPDAAPSYVRALYPGVHGGVRSGGYGYQLGEVVGITSVSVPHATPLSMLMAQSAWFWASAVIVLGLMALSFLLTYVGVVRPLRKITSFTDAMANSSDVEELGAIKLPKFDSDERTSHNEIHREAFALKSLYESMRSAMLHIRSAGNRK